MNFKPENELQKYQIFFYLKQRLDNLIAFIYKNPNITWEFIKDNPEINWSYADLSHNPNINWDHVNYVLKSGYTTPHNTWDYPGLIKSNMIDVQPPICKDYFIDALLNSKSLFDDTVLPFQCRLFIKQQGAGNGKTFGIINMIQSEDYMHYKNFIYVSKQHSAVHVIFSEFQQQLQKGFLQLIELKEEKKENKKYIIKYVNLKTNQDCQIIIGTVDSFMYSKLDKFPSFTMTE